MLQKIKASLYRDTRELFRNMTLLTSAVLPILLGTMFFYATESIDGEGVDTVLYDRIILIQFYIVYGISLMSVLTFNITTSTSEENEKKYLEHFVHSESDYQATLWSKVILYSIVSVVVLIIVMSVFRPDIAFNRYDYIGMAAIFIVFIILGVAIGLISKNVSQTSAYIIPFMILFTMTPMGEVVLGPYNEAFLSVAWMNLLYLNMMIHEGDVLFGMIGNGVYIVVSLVVLVICYRYKQFKIR